jgi:hypothetical protein
MAMGHFIGWVIAEVGEYALFSFLARLTRTQWIVILMAAILAIIAVTGELTWAMAAAVLLGTIVLWALLLAIDLAMNKVMRH